MDSFDSSLLGDWAITNEGIYFINVGAEHGVSIQFFDFASRKTSLVASLGKIRILDIGIAVSPDRQQILYTQNDQYGADITLVENFQ